MFVYVIVNQVNQKYYVGKTTTPDLSRYLSRKFSEASRSKGGSHLFAAMRKYGHEAFTIHPLVSTGVRAAWADPIKRANMMRGLAIARTSEACKKRADRERNQLGRFS
jgi:hypothetical protein